MSFGSSSPGSYQSRSQNLFALFVGGPELRFVVHRQGFLQSYSYCFSLWYQALCYQNIFGCLSIIYHVCKHVGHDMRVWRLKDFFSSCFFSFTMQVLGIELGYLDLTTSTLTCQAISLVPLSFVFLLEPIIWILCLVNNFLGND